MTKAHQWLGTLLMSVLLGVGTGCGDSNEPEFPDGGMGGNSLPGLASCGLGVPLEAGDFHTCALLQGGAVRCWGQATRGALGYGNTNNIGDDETPAAAGDVNVGGPVVQLAAGSDHTCALLQGGAVRCWGEGADGQLGYGNTNDIGDDEMPASAGDVNVGGVLRTCSAPSL